ncbi:MAG: hypothetical protein HY521_14320 [Proteobacteria bacterium]|nr:hypothetical protein [Pseudomonadota bacterium]
MTRVRSLSVALFGVVALLAVGAPAAEDGEKGVPRFASLRAGEVNLRTGPGRRYPVEWKFLRESLPVEVLVEYDTWRKVRDSEGTVGWVHQSMLSGKRTLIVTGEPRPLRREPVAEAPPRAVLEPGVIATILSCPPTGAWCRVALGPHEGWLRRDEFWGVYPNEAVN